MGFINQHGGMFDGLTSRIDDFTVIVVRSAADTELVVTIREAAKIASFRCRIRSPFVSCSRTSRELCKR